MIHLEPVTPENWRCGLRVREDQRRFAADSAGLLARAYAYRAHRSEAVRLLLQRLKTDGKFEKAVLCYVDGDEAARHLYEKLGFHPTGEAEEDEIVMERML